MPTFIRLVEVKKGEKKLNFNNKNYYYNIANQNIFLRIPRNIISYWETEKVINCFDNFNSVSSSFNVRQGLASGDNDVFLRYWFEVNFFSINFDINFFSFDCNKKKFVPHNKGGEFRKWYGNKDTIIWFDENSIPILSKQGNCLPSREYYFKRSIEWSRISVNTFSVRYSGYGSTFDSASATLIEEGDKIFTILGYLNSKVNVNFLRILSPTLTFQVGDVRLSPLNNKIFDRKNLNNIVTDSIKISKQEWNSRETSWDFTKNELIRHKQETYNLESSVNTYISYWKNKFFKLHQNEEELNKIFIDIYDLNDELTPDVPLDEITILKDETEIKDGELVFKKDVIIKQFLSYFVGCLMGRYSLDKDGLILANKGETLQDYLIKIPNPSFTPDDDNIIPILDDEYFDDDIITRLKEFLKTTFGQDSLSENLQFIADALYTRGKGSAEETIRHYFLKQFYKDHCQMYKKRPIYWMFTSGKQNAFSALIYMHRYNKELLAKLRIDYLHEYQSKLQARKQSLPLDSDDIKIRTQAEKEKTIINKKLKELQDYDQHLQNLANKFIDIYLDDGVNENYKKFTPLLEKIK